MADIHSITPVVIGLGRRRWDQENFVRDEELWTWVPSGFINKSGN